jgi:hypothetical protein
MRKNVIENAAYEVAIQVRAVEDVIENSLAEIAELQSRTVRARGATGIGIGQSPFEKLAGATQALIGARGSIAECHSALVATQKHVPGLRTVAFGDVVPCLDEASERAPLRVVA